MQALAQENNQAETAFLRRTGEPCRFDLRWFTAHGGGGPVRATPRSPRATCCSTSWGWTGRRRCSPPVPASCGWRGTAAATAWTCPSTRHAAARPSRAWARPWARSRRRSGPGVSWWRSCTTRRRCAACAPTSRAVMRVASAATGGRGNVAVTALADPGADYDVVSRFFAPGSGIPEDPATGSLHCLLAPALCAEKLGRQRARFHQAYPGRGGRAGVRGGRRPRAARRRRVHDGGVAVAPVTARRPWGAHSATFRLPMRPGRRFSSAGHAPPNGGAAHL